MLRAMIAGAVGVKDIDAADYTLRAALSGERASAADPAGPAAFDRAVGTAK